jgi:hypothetical protein
MIIVSLIGLIIKYIMMATGLVMATMFGSKYLKKLRLRITDSYPLYSKNFPQANYSEGKRDILVFDKLFDNRTWPVTYLDNELTMRVDIKQHKSKVFDYNIVFEPIILSKNNQVCTQMKSPQITNHLDMLDCEDPETYVKNSHNKPIKQKIYWQNKESICRTITYVPKSELIIEDQGYGPLNLSAKKSRIIMLCTNNKNTSYSYNIVQNFEGLFVESEDKLIKHKSSIPLNDKILNRIVYTFEGQDVLIIEYDS